MKPSRFSIIASLIFSRMLYVLITPSSSRCLRGCMSHRQISVEWIYGVLHWLVYRLLVAVIRITLSPYIDSLHNYHGLSQLSCKVKTWDKYFDTLVFELCRFIESYLSCLITLHSMHCYTPRTREIGKGLLFIQGVFFHWASPKSTPTGPPKKS